MKLKIITSHYVEPGKMYVIDAEAAGALADSVRMVFDLDDPDHVDVKVCVVATDALKERLNGFAAAIGVEVVE